MQCQKCGAEVSDDIAYCPHCGAKLKRVNNEQSSTLQTIAFVFMIISTVTSAIAIIPLCWTIPMTVYLWTSMRDGRKTGIAFQICTLIFVSLVAGILLLVDGQEDY